MLVCKKEPSARLLLSIKHFFELNTYGSGSTCPLPSSHLFLVRYRICELFTPTLNLSLVNLHHDISLLKISEKTLSEVE